jgi:hypothetical protein
MEYRRGVDNAYSCGACHDHLIELWARTGYAFQEFEFNSFP